MVTLRPWAEEDVVPSVDGHDHEIMRWFGQPEPPTYDGLRTVFARWAEERAAGSRIGFGIHANGELVGGVEARPDGDVTSLSWWLFAGHRGHGYASRATRLLADHAIERLGARRVEAEVDPRNEASLRVATRAGLRREGVRRVEPGMAEAPDATGTSSSPGWPATRRSPSRRASAPCSTPSSPASARSASCWCATVTAGS